MEQLKISSHSFKQILGWLIRNILNKKKKTSKVKENHSIRVLGNGRNHSGPLIVPWTPQTYSFLRVFTLAVLSARFMRCFLPHFIQVSVQKISVQKITLGGPFWAI